MATKSLTHIPSLPQFNFLQLNSQSAPPSFQSEPADWLKACQSRCPRQMAFERAGAVSAPTSTRRAGSFLTNDMSVSTGALPAYPTKISNYALTLKGLSLAGSANGLLSKSDILKRLRAVLSCLKRGINRKVLAAVGVVSTTTSSTEAHGACALRRLGCDVYVSWRTSAGRSAPPVDFSFIVKY